MKKFSVLAFVIVLITSVLSATPARAATNYALGAVSCGGWSGTGWNEITEINLIPGDTFTFRPDSGCFNSWNGSSWADVETSIAGPVDGSVSYTYVTGGHQSMFNYEPASTMYQFGVAANTPYGVIDQYVSVCSNCGDGRFFKIKVVDPASLLPRGVTAVIDLAPHVAPISVTGISVHKTSDCAGSPITISGDGVANSTVAVGGKSVKVISNDENQVTFECPVLEVGSHNVVLTNSRGKLTFEGALQIVAGANRYKSVEKTLPNVSGKNISNSAKAALKNLLAKNALAKELTCTSSSANKLAASAVCAYAKKLKPALIVSTRVMKTAPLSVSLLFE